MKKANDIPSLIHEVGHHVHKLLWGRVGQKLHSAPLQAFADELKPLDYNPNKGRIFEGFAEFVREYVMVPDSARKAAPKFYEFFERQLDTRTDLADTLLGSRSDWARWTGQDPIDRLMGSIVVTLPPDQRPWMHVAKDKWDDFYTRWTSSFDPMMEATKAMAKGKDIPVEKHPYYLAQVLSDSAGVAQQYLDSGTFDPITHKPTGEGLKTILKRVQDVPISDRVKSKILARIKTDDPKAKFGQFDDRLWALRAYLVAKRVVEKTGEQGIETGIALKDAQATVAELENPTMESVAKDFYEYQNRVLHYAVRRGVMSAEQETKINELNQNYARFSRVMEDEPGRVAAGAQGQAQPVRKMRGSTRDIYDPLEGAIYNTHAIIKWADRQAAVNALIDLAENSDASGWMVDKYRPKAKAFTFNLQEVKKEIEEIVGQKIDKEDLDIFKTLYRAGTQVPPGKNIISTLRDGKQEFYQLNDLLYRALRPHSEYDSAIVKSALRVMAPPARLLRLGAVGLNPEFTGITNPSRDLLTAFMQSEYGGGDPRKMMDYIHQGEIGKAAEELFGATIFPRIWYTMQGLKETGQHELHKAFPEKIPDSKQVQEWRSAWGEHAAYFGVDRKHLIDSLKDLMASSPAYAKAHPIEVLRIIGELTENMTRQGEYGLARRKGASPLEAVVKGSRPVTVDFSRAGLVGRVVNQVTAFFNAKVQGTDQFARAHFKRNLPRTMMRGITMITVPALLLQLLNQDDPEYEELPQWQKDWFFMIPTKYFGNETLYNATPFIPLPKPFLWGLIYGTIPERVFQAIVKKDPEASKGILPMILKEAIPNPFGITAAIPIIESWAKKSFFTLQGTEPGYVSTLSKQYRAKGYTTEFSRSLSEFLYDTGMGKTIEEQTGLELTPINIDNLIFGWTGSVGMHVTRIGNIIDPDAPAATLKDIPLIRALAVRSPNSQSDSITKFYDRYEELGQKAADARSSQRLPEGPAKGAVGLSNAEQAELKRLRFFHGKISSRWKHDREIRDDQKLDRDQKRERLDQNTQEMINLAREAIGRRPYGRPTRKKP
ncbi:MAG TPA: LPD38 domain-containing protein [Phycisphaerae bacterium]|nr:LPD38 domain-containing protein [Phycisphaerae bacterium]